VRFKLWACLICYFLQIPLAISGLRCDLLKRLDDPKLLENALFWKEYSELAGKNILNDRSLNDLFNKHKVELKISPIEVSTTIKPPISMTISKRATKEIKNLPTKAMRRNFEEFVDIMNGPEGMKELYKNPSKWHAEKLNSFSTGNVYTIRLNEAYRVMFKLEKNVLEILEVNAAHIHTF
jgi:plasmid maintenance system killer protein